MSFSGFTDDDIRKISQNHNGDKSVKESNSRSNQKKVTFKITAQKSSNKEKKIKELLHNSITASSNEIPVEAKLELKPHQDSTETEILQNTASLEQIELVENDLDKNRRIVPTESEKIVQNSINLKKMESIENDQDKNSSIGRLESEKRFIDLNEFEARQKLIEEQNRKRKELLAKALADRTKRTQEEAQRLQEIQEEFKKLDAILSNDVRILRKQIEIASFEYTECQKKYDRIEREFLDAKLLLHQKLEKKELLTEHLCAIIEKNEERKAEKLMELLKKLEINSIDGKDSKIDQT